MTPETQKPISRYAEHLVPGYSELAEVGKSQGFLVFGHDHVGHGQSEGERALVGDMGQLTNPVVQHCREKVDQYPGVPLFIIGHSMGGLINLLASLSPQMPRLSGLHLKIAFLRQNIYLTSLRNGFDGSADQA